MTNIFQKSEVHFSKLPPSHVNVNDVTALQVMTTLWLWRHSVITFCVCRDFISTPKCCWRHLECYRWRHHRFDEASPSDHNHRNDFVFCFAASRGFFDFCLYPETMTSLKWWRHHKWCNQLVFWPLSKLDALKSESRDNASSDLRTCAIRYVIITDDLMMTSLLDLATRKMFWDFIDGSKRFWFWSRVVFIRINFLNSKILFLHPFRFR